MKGTKINKQNAKSLSRDHFSDQFSTVLEGARNQLSKPAHSYLESMTTPETAPAARIPTLMGGVSGRTGTCKTQCKFIMTLGDAGFGFVAMDDPNNIGPVTDRVVATYSENGLFNSNVVPVPASWVSPAYWTNGITEALNLDLDDLSWRCSGYKAVMKPIDSIAGSLAQSGRVVGIQEPSGDDMSNSTFNNISTRMSALTGSGININSSDKETLQLTWKPKMKVEGTDGAADPFRFHHFDTAIATYIAPPMVLAASGVKNQKFEIKIFANWELLGRLVQNKKSVPADSRGMDLVLFALNERLSSAHFSSSRELYHQSLSHVYRAVVNSGIPHEIRNLVTDQKNSSWWNVIKKLAPAAATHVMGNFLGL